MTKDIAIVGLAAAVLCLVPVLGRAAEPFFAVQDLYEGKENRIPNVVVAADGSVLAFAGAGRRVRRSEDGGQTFSPVQEVGHDAHGSAIVDSNTGNVMVVDSGKGHLWRSADHGKTWTREAIVVKPNPLGHGGPGAVPVHTSCSESGVTMQFGPHKGRLLMPARVQPRGRGVRLRGGAVLRRGAVRGWRGMKDEG